MSDYIFTYSKIKFYPLEPVKTDINIADIAGSGNANVIENGNAK